MSAKMTPSARLATAALCAVVLSCGQALAHPEARAKSSQSTRPLTLEQAVRIALDWQPQLVIARSQVATSRARLIESASSYFPQLTPSLQYTSQGSSYRVGGQTSTQTSDRTETAIGLRQLVFDMGKREASVAAARSGVRASEYSLRSARQTVILNVTTAFYEVLRRRELLRVQETAVEHAKTTYEATKAFVEAGTVRPIDILQAEADYRNAEVQLGIARNDVRLAEASLRNAIGLDTAETVTAADRAPAWPEDKPDSQGVRTYAARAMDNRPDLKRDLALLDADRASARVARINAGLLVEADLTAGYRLDPDPGNNRMLVATLSFPLFDAGASRARARSAEESVRQSSEQLKLARQDIHLAVEEAYLSREEARSRIAAARVAAAAAKANFEAASAGYKEGAQTVVDVITARTQLVTAETNLVQSLYDFHAAAARLDRAVGDNDPHWTGGK